MYNILQNVIINNNFMKLNLHNNNSTLLNLTLFTLLHMICDDVNFGIAVNKTCSHYISSVKIF